MSKCAPQQKGPDKISVGDSWKRDAQDKQQTADLLQQEVKQLQAKVQHSIEESERLRRLSLELQFQRRLEEFQQMRMMRAIRGQIGRGFRQEVM